MGETQIGGPDPTLGAATHMLRVGRYPAFLRPEVRRFVDIAPVVARGAILRNGNQTQQDQIARLRVIDTRYLVIGYLMTAVLI